MGIIVVNKKIVKFKSFLDKIELNNTFYLRKTTFKVDKPLFFYFLFASFFQFPLEQTLLFGMVTIKNPKNYLPTA